MAPVVIPKDKLIPMIEDLKNRVERGEFKGIFLCAEKGVAWGFSYLGLVEDRLSAVEFVFLSMELQSNETCKSLFKRAMRRILEKLAVGDIFERPPAGVA